MCAKAHPLSTLLVPRPREPEFVAVASVVRTWALSCTCIKHSFALLHSPCMPGSNHALALVCVLHMCLLCASVFTPQQMVRDRLACLLSLPLNKIPVTCVLCACSKRGPPGPNHLAGGCRERLAEECTRRSSPTSHQKNALKVASCSA